jgi:hypothetical protein
MESPEQKSEAYDFVTDDPYWTPRTITIVWDIQTGFFLTGATQSVCEQLGFLKETALRVTVIRFANRGSRGSLVKECPEG